MGLGLTFEFRVSREGLLWTWFFWHEVGVQYVSLQFWGLGGIASCLVTLVCVCVL